MNVNIVYQGRITPNGAGQVQQICAQSFRHEVTKITMLICSGGGDVTAGIGMYNFLKMAPLEIHTVNFGICGSIAATVFLAGSFRSSLPAAKFSLHAASFIEGPRKGQVSPNTEAIAAPFRLDLGWQPDMISKYFGTPDEQFIDPHESKELSITHDVGSHSLIRTDPIFIIDPEGASPKLAASLDASPA